MKSRMNPIAAQQLLLQLSLRGANATRQSPVAAK